MADTIELKIEEYEPPKFMCVTCDNNMSESRAFRFPNCDDCLKALRGNPEGGMMRRELNKFQNEVLEYTGLSIPRFAHRRNRVRCSDCGLWFKACKYLGKEIADDDKFADAWGVNVHPGVICGKCGRKYWTKADNQSVALPDFRKVSKRRLKIRIAKKMMEQNDDD